MALKLLLDSLDGVEEGLRSLYKAGDDGKFRLDVDGVEDTSGLKSALEKERLERKKLEQTMAKYKDIDPAKYDEAVKKLQELEDQNLLNEGKLDELVEKRIERLKKDHENQLAQMTKTREELTAQVDALKGQLSKVVIERGIIDAVNAVAQPRKEALQDIINRGQATWKLDEKGLPTPLKPDGSTIYGKDGVAIMSMGEWAQDLVTEAPHLFMPSQGGGASSQSSGMNKGGYTPEQLAGMTPQQKLTLARKQAK